MLCSQCQKAVASITFTAASADSARAQKLCAECFSNYLSLYAPPNNSKIREQYNLMASRDWQYRRELEESLQHAIENEDYETAAKYRDELAKLDSI